MDDDMKDRLQELARGPRRVLDMQELKRNAARRAARDRVLAGGTALAVGVGGYAGWSALRGGQRPEVLVAPPSECDYMGRDFRVFFGNYLQARASMQKAIVPGVETIRIVSSAEALREFKADHPNRPVLWETLTAKSLPPYLEIFVEEDVDARVVLRSLPRFGKPVAPSGGRKVQRTCVQLSRRRSVAELDQERRTKWRTLIGFRRIGGKAVVDERLEISKSGTALFQGRLKTSNGWRDREETIPLPRATEERLRAAIRSVKWEQVNGSFIVNGTLVADGFRYRIEYDGYEYEGWDITPKERQLRPLLRVLDEIIVLAKKR